MISLSRCLTCFGKTYNHHRKDNRPTTWSQSPLRHKDKWKKCKGEFVNKVVNKKIFTDFEPTKLSSAHKPQTLVPRLRIWHRILLTCINPRPLNFSPDYINANQKCLLYHLQNKDKLCLPAILFLHLRESILKSRTTANETNKIIKYIPFGRLISDILVENGLVRFLRDEAQFTIDLTASIGDTLSGKNLKNMEIINKVLVEPTPEDDEGVVDRRQMVDDFPPFSKEEPFEVIMEYVRLQVADGKDMSGFTYDMLPDTMGDEESKKKRKKKSSEANKTGEEKAAKKQKKTEKERDLHLKSYSEASARGTSEFQTSGIHTPSQIETSTHIPPSTTTTPTFIISTQPTPISSLSPVITPLYSNTPTSESIHVFAPLVSEISVSKPMPISSAPPTGNIPVVYLDISGDEILISDE